MFKKSFGFLWGKAVFCEGRRNNAGEGGFQQCCVRKGEVVWV